MRSGAQKSESSHHDPDFKFAQRSISKIFRKYSIDDIVTSLFTSSIWLPNVASPVKHLFLTAVFASIKPADFSTSRQIGSYDDFKSFLGKVHHVLPSFTLLEDYVPELDWGDVKFHHEEKNYKIFYGCEMENVYDYLILFQMLYGPFDNEYLIEANRSPVEELRFCLKMQDDILSGIDHQPSAETLTELYPGHIEVPPLSFWKNASEFYGSYSPDKSATRSLVENYSMPIGKTPSTLLDYDTFLDGAYSGRLLSVFFITHGGRYYPVLPRRFSPVLFDAWTKVFEDYGNELAPDSSSYSMQISVQLHHYINERTRDSKVFPLASVVTPQEKPHEVIFSSAFISRNRLVLLYLTNPTSSHRNVVNELIRVAPQIEEAVDLVSRSPHKLALHLERKMAQFDSRESSETLEPLVFVLIPQTSSLIEPVSVPESLPGQVMFLDQFLGIIDELEDGDELAFFNEFLEEIKDQVSFPLISPLDKFASFRWSHGVLVSGALEYTGIMLDPHWGSSMRFESLAAFWKLYPRVGFYRHPRSWKLTQETDSRTRLGARGFLESALHCRLGSTHIFLNAPFHRMSYEQARIANLLMECLEDSLSRNETILEHHRFFKNFEQFQVSFFPHSIVSKDDDFSHLRHLDPHNETWCSDRGYVKVGVPGIRVVFDKKSVFKAFEGSADRSTEIKLLLEVLRHLNVISPDSLIESIEQSLLETKSERPRFTMAWIKKEASFPDLVPTYEVTPFHYKKATKRLAELAKRLNITHGSHSLDDAKIKLNNLRSSIVSELDLEVRKYGFPSAIPFLLIRIDALTHEHELQKKDIEDAANREVDYDRDKKLAGRKSKYISFHRSYRYLIEKFVQLQPQGSEVLGKEQFQYLIALVDWVHQVYQASDSLHYEVSPVGITIDREFRLSIEYEPGFESKQETFEEEQAKIDLSLRGNPDDRVDSPRPAEDFLNEVDRAFRADLGFGLRSMTGILVVLARWAEYDSDATESPFYNRTAERIEEICLKNVRDINQHEVSPILNFLTLTSHDVVRILDRDKQLPCEDPCDDIPVWEHNKRYARYILRPLILIDNVYYWGPYSALKAAHNWSNSLSMGTLPVNLPHHSVRHVVEREKRLIERALEVRALQIMERFTPFAKRNVTLHKIDKKGNHPRDLGDYDVLAFLPEKTTVLCIECKDILPAYCLKDAKTLREKIFGISGQDKGQLGPIDRRYQYLSNHLVRIGLALGWPLDVNKPPDVIPIYLSRRDFWWTRFPPEDIEVVFLRVDLLAQFIDEL